MHNKNALPGSFSKHLFQKDYSALIAGKSISARSISGKSISNKTLTSYPQLHSPSPTTLKTAPQKSPSSPKPPALPKQNSSDKEPCTAQQKPTQAPAQNTQDKKPLAQETTPKSYGGFTLQFPSSNKNGPAHKDNAQDETSSSKETDSSPICRWLIICENKPSEALTSLTKAIKTHLFPQVTAIELEHQAKKPLLPFTRLLLGSDLSFEQVKRKLLEETAQPAIETVRFFSSHSEASTTTIPNLEAMDKKEKLAFWNHLSKIAKADLDEL